jgi:hypothetical protein
MKRNPYKWLAVCIQDNYVIELVTDKEQHKKDIEEGTHGGTSYQYISLEDIIGMFMYSTPLTVKVILQTSGQLCVSMQGVTIQNDKESNKGRARLSSHVIGVGHASEAAVKITGIIFMEPYEIFEPYSAEHTKQLKFRMKDGF